MFLIPQLVYAQATDFKGLIKIALDLLKSVIPVIIGIGLVVFLFGIVRYITPGQSEEKIKEGRNMMIYGLIALFVMTAVWGLVGVLTSTFFGGALSIPQLQ